MQEDYDNLKNRLSETAQKIVLDCEQIARAMDTGIDTQHLLVSLASNQGTISYEILRELMVTPQRIVYLLQNPDFKLKTSDTISADFKRVLKTATQRAVAYQTPTVDSEHLLLALSVNKETNAYKILTGLAVDPKMLKDQLESHFGQAEELVNNLPEVSEEILDEGEGQFAQFTQAPPRSPNRAKSAIDYFTNDLTKEAKAGKLDPVIGREKEIQRMSQILVRRGKNNPVLTGEPGVGKTAIVEGLASQIISGDVPRQLADKRVVSLDLALLISGTTYRGQFEERAKKLIDEILKAGNIILFIDELHTIVGAGAAEGSVDLSHILKPVLSKGQLRLIGATTNDEYRKHIERDPALERRLQRVNVEEPSSEETVKILHGLKKTYEKHHNVTIDDDAVVAAVDLSKRYISDRFLPDKAIDLIDEAAAATQLEERQIKISTKLTELEKKRQDAHQEHTKAADIYDYEKAASWRVLEYRYLDEIEKLKLKLPKRTVNRVITREDIAKIVSMWTGVPVTALAKTQRVRLVNLEKVLKTHIVGQDEAVGAISGAIRRSTVGVADPNRPLGSFIFLGPTGVGKTELARVLAREVFGRDEALIKVDMSEFMERHNVSRLVGAPPGYVGYEEAGKLTETVRRQPYSVVLLDEIEKAHPDVFNMLLQIMEDGQLTDAKGRVINFRNTILIMTSNIGLAEMNRQQAIGFKVKDGSLAENRYEEIKTQVLAQLKDNFRPEFINRLDKAIVFKPLNKVEVKQIVQLQINRLVKRLVPEGIEIEIEESAKEFLAEKGFDPEFGARPVRRVITEYIEDPLSELLLTGKLSKKAPIRVLRKGEKLALVK
ncbi:MAG: ATP-dependent Clp protease ATP-binding subunit [Candidatus Berkelbacteria bacterium]|nr:ATP-dependent Clp protease ATP-binding subunit [Candidatus Berkelbacteria bacterium]MCR4307239.1 ATP-dependent Clp protease ATP-binding subunit [Candidatus Berkelbacteria bacterium]